MAKVNPGKNQIQRVQPPAGTDLPEHLRGRRALGVDVMREYVVLPKLKVVQKSAAAELLAGNSVGDILILPTKTALRRITKTRGAPDPEGPKFVFVPIFFFPSWCALNDIKKKGVEPTYLKYTLDKNDPLVALCKNPATRETPHPNDPKCVVKNCEQLNFVCLIEDAGELTDQPVVITFMRGSYRSGSDLAARIRMSNADIFARRWVGRSKHMTSKGFDYYGIEVMRFEDALLDETFAADHGDESPWVTAEAMPNLEKAHLQIAKQFELQGIKGVEDEDDAAEPAASSPAGNKY